MKKTKLCLFTISVLFSSFSLNSISKEIVINSESLKKIHDKSLKSNSEMAFKDKDYKSSVELFSELLLKEPNNEDYTYKLAYSLYMTQNLDESKLYFKTLADKSNNSFYKTEAKKYLIIIAKDKIKNKLASKKNLKNTHFIIKEEVVELKNIPDVHYLCNPISSSIFNGSFMRWEKEDFPIKVYIPSVPEKFKENVKVNYQEIAKQGFNRWEEKAPDLIKIQYVSSAEKANVVIKWEEYFKGEAWGLSTYPTYNKNLKKRVSNIFLATKAQPGSAFFSIDAVNFGEDEFIKIAIHEFGHTLGLNHSYDKIKNIDIMQPVFNLYKIDISDRDLESLKKLYTLPKNAKVICK